MRAQPKALVLNTLTDHAIRVGEGNEDNANGQRLLDLCVGIRLGSVRQARSLLVGVQQIRDEVQQPVCRRSLSSVDVAVEIRMVRIIACASPANLAAHDGASLVGSVRCCEGAEAICGCEGCQTAGDLSGTEDRGEGGAGGSGTETLGRDGAAAEAIASANGGSGA